MGKVRKIKTRNALKRNLLTNPLFRSKVQEDKRKKKPKHKGVMPNE